MAVGISCEDIFPKIEFSRTIYEIIDIYQINNTPRLSNKILLLMNIFDAIGWSLKEFNIKDIILQGVRVNNDIMTFEFLANEIIKRDGIKFNQFDSVLEINFSKDDFQSFTTTLSIVGQPKMTYYKK